MKDSVVMDDMSHIFLMSLAPIIITPFVIWIIRKIKGKRKPKLIAQCPHCRSLIGLDKVKNYICGKCKRAVGFINLDTNLPLENTVIYQCDQCENDIFDGILTCSQCGNYHSDRIH